MKSRNLRLFYIHETFFQFSDSMLIIVLPIFLFKLFGSVSMVFLFTLAWNVIYITLFIPIFNLAMRLGKPKYFMMIGIIFYIISLSLFSQITKENIQLIIPANIIFALYISFYWMVRHWFFSVNADHEKIGKQVSSLAIIRTVISFIAPIVGGWISFFVSFNATFILGSIAGLFSLIPILFFHAPPHPRLYNFKKVKRILNKPELKAIRPAHFFEGMSNHFINNSWVLAFAIFIGSILDLGLLVGITTLITAVLIRLAGHWFDKRKRSKLLVRMTWIKTASVLIYPSIFFFPNLIYVWGVELINRFVGNMHQTIADSYLYAYSSKIHPIHFHLNREIYLSIARLITSIILAITFYFLPPEFLWLTIAIGAFMLLGWLNLKKSDHLLH